MKASVVIRNKNEAISLADCLELLTRVYADYIGEIIIVDNNSTDNSLEVAKRYGCRIVKIDDFTYGRAINMGIRAAHFNEVLLLSAHAMPIGSGFFKKSFQEIAANPKAAGIRYVNNIANYKRAVENDFQVVDGLQFGLMAACAMVNKSIWEKFKFDESLEFSEDKAWSETVIEAGYQILDLNETHFYFAKRSEESLLNRWHMETLAHYKLHDKKYPGGIKLIGTYLRKVLVRNPIILLKMFQKDTQKLKRSFAIRKALKRHKK